MSNKNKVILITGTPGTGKTTIADQLNRYLSDQFNSKLIKINEFAIKNDLIDGEDIEKTYKIINLDMVDKKLNEKIWDFFLILITTTMAVIIPIIIQKLLL